MRRTILLMTILSLSFGQTIAQENVFHVENPDYEVSPLTGMTRRHWKDAAQYLLDGAFRHVKDLDTPMYFERMGNVCYPKDERRVRGATLEGLCRTLFVAAPLLREDSMVTASGIRLKDYYRHQLCLLVDEKSAQHVPWRGKRGPCQDLVEFGGLAISLFVCGDVVWDPLPQAIRDSLFNMMESYGDGPTISQNWRFFNIFVMSFFKSKGYKVNDALMEKYLRQLLNDYRGNGWYLDHPNYDYYSMWAYQLYGKLWSRFFGHAHYPDIAKAFEQNFAGMYGSYPLLFGRDGTLPMWGRSNMYRFAAVAPLAWGTEEENMEVNYGWMRRIASGCLLQFLRHPDLMDDGVPVPGFYGLFDPVLQGYSCRGSVYWCAKAFLPLLLDGQHPYWTAVENEGEWNRMKPNQVYNHYLEGPRMLITNYPSIGASEVRAWCDYNTARKNAELFRGSEQYNRLAYNTAFPWMADGKHGEVAQNYLVRNNTGEWEPLRRYKTVGFANGTLTRTVWLQSDDRMCMTLTDRPLPNGMMRTDTITSLPDSIREIHLGGYALPEYQKPIQRRTIKIGKGKKAYLISNGEYELAMIPLKGVRKVRFVRAEDLHPETKHCEVLNADIETKKGTVIQVVELFKKGLFTEEELRESLPAVNTSVKKNRLFPLSEVRIKDKQMEQLQQLDRQYLLSLDSDRLLSWFRREAGLPMKADPYPYWESENVWGGGPLSGHILGFYLSSMAMMYESTGDATIPERLKTVIAGMRECQLANRNGYLLATPGGKPLFEQVAKGEFKTNNPTINGIWEPVYVMNKIMLGLYDVYMACGIDDAKTILVGMADWFGEEIIDKLNHEQMQRLLVCEHGSINESYVNVYQLTDEYKYLEWAMRLNDEDMWMPAARETDVLNGWHANTQIPKFTGFECVANLTGNEAYRRASRFFWKTVVDKHTWANGGNSTGEHFFSSDQFEKRILNNGGPESCNTVNMMRLTERLYEDDGEMKYVDYYERALYNHILANYDPEEGMCVYYTSMRPGHYKIYGTKYDSFWCCTGTGMQAPAKLGRMIYAQSSDTLYVNMYIASELNWVEEGVRLTQSTRFPDENNVRFDVSRTKKGHMTIAFRIPSWNASDDLRIQVNGKTDIDVQIHDGYAFITRKWGVADHIDLTLTPVLRHEMLNGSSKYAAFLYGPVLLGTAIESGDLRGEDFRMARTTVARKQLPVDVSPSIQANLDELIAGLKRTGNKSLEFECHTPLASKNFKLVPYNRIHFSRYTVYFPIGTN